MKNKKSKKKILIIFVSILLLILLVPTLYINSKLSKLNIQKINKSPNALGIDEKKFQNSLDDDYVNILFLGIDSRDPKKDPGRNDSTIIMTLDKKHKKIKLTSVLRDTVMTMKGQGPMEGFDKDRLGHAHAYGGPEFAIKVINSNFNMNIKDYVKIYFSGLKNVIDSLGGVSINVKSYETSQIPNCTKAGLQNLDGTQALAYARIRHVGNSDYERTDRQRTVLNELFKKFSAKGVLELPGLANEILPNVETSLSKSTILSLATYSLTNKIATVEQLRLPSEQKSVSINNVSFVDIDKAKDIPKLHDFIFEGDLK